MLTAVSGEMLGQTVASVFANVLDLQVDRCEALWIPDAQRLVASIQLAGEWNGALLFECSPSQACQFAGHFLGTEPAQTADSDVQDVLGELANMIAGNVKFSVAKGLILSMPSVANRSEYTLRANSSESDNRVAFQCDYGQFWVTLVATSAEESAAHKVPA